MEGGPKTPFSTTLPVVGAVVVRCGRFVESIRLLSPEEAAMNSRDPKIYRANEHIFELLPGEKLMKLEVYSGHWVDCIRFTTTLRVGPWFGGGRGPTIQSWSARQATTSAGFMEFSVSSMWAQLGPSTALTARH